MVALNKIRKSYKKPMLTTLGKVEEITKSGANMSYSDGLKGTRPKK